MADESPEKFEAVRYSFKGRLYVDPKNPQTIPGNVLACGTHVECRAAIAEAVIRQFLLDIEKDGTEYDALAWSLLRLLRWSPPEAEAQAKNIQECFTGGFIDAKRGGWYIRRVAK
jgi:hypothetical protein